MESGERITTEPWRSARATANGSPWQEKYRRSCREQRVDYVPLDTRTPFDRALLAYLEAREPPVKMRVLSVLTFLAGAPCCGGARHPRRSAGQRAESRHLRAEEAASPCPRPTRRTRSPIPGALPHGIALEWSGASAASCTAVSFEGWNQRMMMARRRRRAPRTRRDLTRARRTRHRLRDRRSHAAVPPPGGWNYSRLLALFRPNHGGQTPWGRAARVRVSGWLLYDWQYDHVPTSVVAPRTPRARDGMGDPSVTRIERWDESRAAWIEVPR